jgi:dolichol-phosphate mannosyltransferase
VSLEFLTVVADKLVGRWIPIRFVAFVLVGSFGVLVHIAVLATAFRWLALDFAVSQALGTYTAMTVNYFVNNQFTYRDMRLRGFAMLRGLLSFVAICTVGAVVNLQVAKVLFEHGVMWLLAGLLGAVVGSVWNYGVSSTLTWRVRNKG